MTADAQRTSAADEIASRLPDSMRARFHDNYQLGHLNYSDATRRALDSKWRGWIAYTDAQGIAVLTPALQEIAAYLESRSDNWKLASVKVFLFAFRRLYEWTEQPNPLETEAGAVLLRRICGKVSNERRIKAPLRLEDLEAILSKLDGSNIRDVRDAAMFSLAYEAMLAPSEIVALEITDIEFHADGTASICIESRRADTPGLTRRSLTEATADYIRQWLKKAGVTNGCLFRALRGPMSRHPRVLDRFGEGDFRRRIKSCCERAGLDPSRFTGMSAIVGATIDLALDGTSLRAIARAGRYDTLTMVTRYTEHLTEADDVMHRMLKRRSKRRSGTSEPVDE